MLHQQGVLHAIATQSKHRSDEKEHIGPGPEELVIDDAAPLGFIAHQFGSERGLAVVLAT
jgi:hypothetical protein